MPPTDQPTTPPGDQQVGAAMRAAREARGVGLREMARQLGYSAHSNLSDYESGKRLPQERLVADYERVLELESGTLTEVLETALDKLGGTRPPPQANASNKTDSTVSPAVIGDSSHRPDVVESSPRPQKRRRMLVMVIASVSVLLAGAMAFWVITRTSVPQPTQQGAAALYPDGADPNTMGCEYDAVKPDRVHVYDPPQHLVGTLELVSSPKCGMSWGRFVPTVALTTSPTVRLHIDMHRPSDGATAPFAVDFDGQP
jgi:transcriptional regulator with XRE-family HTH domain